MYTCTMWQPVREHSEQACVKVIMYTCTMWQPVREHSEQACVKVIMYTCTMWQPVKEQACARAWFRLMVFNTTFNNISVI